MPELPEVEAARKAVEDHCVGRRIRRAVVADDPKVVEGVSPADFEAALTGKTLVAALRKGKNLWLRLDSPPFPSFQFGMTGAIHIKGVEVTKYKRSAVKSEDEWPPKYSKVFLELDDGLELSFTDKRRFARVRLLQDPESMPPISELGPDALLELMKLDDFMKSLSSKRTPIKALLLDQNFIAGIGNWVADEVLYHAGIHPLQNAASLSREKCEVLHKCIKEVLEKALEVGADSSQFPSNWIFHSREKKPGEAFVCGKKIEFITAGGRTTAYVPELQKLDGTEPGKAGASESRKQTLASKARKQRSIRSSDVVESNKEDTDREAADGVDGGNHLESKRKRGQRKAGATKKPLARKSRASRVGKEESTEEHEDKEESDHEKRVNTGKPKPKKGQNATEATKKPPTKRGRASPDTKEELVSGEDREEESKHEKRVNTRKSKRKKGQNAAEATKNPPTKRGRARPENKEELVAGEDTEEESKHEKMVNTGKSKPKKGQNATEATKNPPTKRGRARPENKEELVAGEDTEEESKHEKRDNTRKLKSKNTAGATKTATRGSTSSHADKGYRQSKTAEGTAQEETKMEDEVLKKRSKAAQMGTQRSKKRQK